jgi:hypothetical protein
MYGPFSIILRYIFVSAWRHLYWYRISPCTTGKSSQQRNQDVVRLGAGLTATIAALVLGLLIGGAKGSFDTRSSQVKQLTANIILLDNLLAQYGPEATPLRKGLRGAINPIVDRLWHERITTEPFTTASEGEKVYLDILALSPQNEIQRSLQARAVQVANDLAQTRLLLFVETKINLRRAIAPIQRADLGPGVSHRHEED